jgi:hypothetical protein
MKQLAGRTGSASKAIAGNESDGSPVPENRHLQPPDVEALLARLDDLYRSKSSIARIDIQVTTPRSTRSLRLKAWTRGEDEALIVIEAPPRDEGTTTLRVGPNLWNYLPRIARTIRIPPSMMLGSWMGTDFGATPLAAFVQLRVYR